jgi:hypothetical protein
MSVDPPRRIPRTDDVLADPLLGSEDDDRLLASVTKVQDACT